MDSALLDKTDDRVRRMFGQIAPWYDTLNHVLSLNIDRSWRKRTVALVPPQGNEPILDVCTGTGDLAIEYRKVAPTEIEIIGTDFTPQMLAKAEIKARRGKCSHLRFIEANAQNLPFPDDMFQIVTVAFGLRNVSEPGRALSEMIRVCLPGGRVAILEFSKPTDPILGRLYRAYFRYLLPMVGQLLSRNRESAYRYLPESVLSFPDGETLATKLREAGLINMKMTRMTFGIATLYVGQKP